MISSQDIIYNPIVKDKFHPMQDILGKVGLTPFDNMDVQQDTLVTAHKLLRMNPPPWSPPNSDKIKLSIKDDINKFNSDGSLNMDNLKNIKRGKEENLTFKQSTRAPKTNVIPATSPFYSAAK